MDADPDYDVLLFTGAPGAGKTTRMRELVAGGHRRWASWTTRPPRPCEVDGLDYVFVSAADFDQAVTQGAMMEHVVGPAGARYGLPAPPALAPGDRLVAIVDEAAAARLPSLLVGLRVAVITLDADSEVLVDRMRSRGDDEAAIAARVAWARRARDPSSEPNNRNEVLR